MSLLVKYEEVVGYAVEDVVGLAVMVVTKWKLIICAESYKMLHNLLLMY